MKIYVKNHKSYYEVQSVAAMFLKDRSFKIVHGEEPSGDEYIYSALVFDNLDATASVEIKLNNRSITKTKKLEDFSSLDNPDSENKYIFSKLTYEILSEFFNVKMDWGILMGVRPVKLATNRLLKNQTNSSVEKDFRERFLVTEKRTKLALEIANNQMDIIRNVDKLGFNLYISIPFCPSRCYYCSFVSSEMEKSKELIPAYVKKLIKEITYTARVVKDTGLKLKTIYIGGGTPTSLSAADLERIIVAILTSFNTKYLEEFTVEAGRPDTITKEKLQVFKELGVNRISINPQSLNDKTLELIGRNHTVKEFYQALDLAKSIGFKSINTDLIAGLRGENFLDFQRTINEIVKLPFENITLHTLSVKKSSRLIEEKDGYTKGEIKKMVDYSYDVLKENNYHPYYLYRQKNSRDNLENVGFSKKGFICKYNILMMEELQSVIACGAGGVTKIVVDNNNIFRIFNYKFSKEYINDFDEMIKRKDLIYKYYKR